MSKIQRVATYLPKTGTHIIKFMNNENLMSKVVIPGKGNPCSWHIDKIITNYENQKPKNMIIKYKDLFASNLFAKIAAKTLVRTNLVG